MTRLPDDKAARDLLLEAKRCLAAVPGRRMRFGGLGVEGGSVYPMILAGCLADLTRTRAHDLAGYLSCKEGDLSCSSP